VDELLEHSQPKIVMDKNEKRSFGTSNFTTYLHKWIEEFWWSLFLIKLVKKKENTLLLLLPCDNERKRRRNHHI